MPPLGSRSTIPVGTVPAVSITIVNRGRSGGSAVLFDIIFCGTIAQLTFAEFFLFGTLLIEGMAISILLDLPDSGINRSLNLANDTSHRNHLKIGDIYNPAFGI